MDRTGPADGDINRITEKASMAVRLATIGAGAVLAVAAAVWLLVRADYFWQNPLKGARFRLVTDFEGTEQAGAISRDGKFIAFLADQDGPVDVWVTQVGTSQFHDLTRSTIRELTNPSVRDNLVLSRLRRGVVLGSRTRFPRKAPFIPWIWEPCRVMVAAN